MLRSLAVLALACAVTSLPLAVRAALASVTPSWPGCRATSLLSVLCH